ncbi:hypothetical protein LYNGBM3L_43980 [Moorena producens 3L]|uniref:Uncharacterized protein n=1 Tax=Moorena producens 3L TaxID=489825 RepID=F4XQC3_9CYAN|nr:hypothetical protein LYNGBM3L_43980 [Moorena producens 3L]
MGEYLPLGVADSGYGFAPLGRVFKLGDPPKSPLKKGDFENGSPLPRGGLGGI